jgi:hypothetical protein
MPKKAKQTSGSKGVQVFELTMDNSEDQEELNRRLRKPGERGGNLSANIGRAGKGVSRTESAGRKRAR